MCHSKQYPSEDFFVEQIIVKPNLLYSSSVFQRILKQLVCLTLNTEKYCSHIQNLEIATLTLLY